MKRLNLFFIFLLSGCAVVNVHTESSLPAGIFLTPDDFLQQKLTYEIDCSNEKEKIKTNELFGSSSGFVIAKGEKHKFDKKKVYGYRSCENKFYRFFNGEAYLIIDTAGFYLYNQYKWDDNTKGKGRSRKDEYFFSKDATGDLELLTKYNLKKVFADNRSFHYSIDANFKSDKELTAFDNFRKEYKIKYLYNQSVK